MIRRATVVSLLVAGAATAIVIAAVHPFGDAAVSAPTAPQPAAPVNWIAAAPGVIEPNGGFLHLGFAEAGQIAEMRVRPGDAVRARDVLVRLVDDEQRARIAAAEAELAFRIADRDGSSNGAGRNDPERLKREVAAAAEDLAKAQVGLDAAKAGAPDASGRDSAALQAALEAADAALQDRQAALRAASAMGATREPVSRKTAAVDAARAELAVARAEDDKTLLRAPVDGTVLAVAGRAGELILPSSDQPIVTIGGTGRSSVRAELDESDAAKVRIGDEATIRNDALGDETLHGRVVAVAPLVARKRIGASSSGTTPVSDAQEIRVEIDTSTALLPGTRVDVFFRTPDDQAKEAVR